MNLTPRYAQPPMNDREREEELAARRTDELAIKAWKATGLNDERTEAFFRESWRSMRRVAAYEAKIAKAKP